MNDVGTWVAFVLQSAVILAMLYLAYKWLLSRSTFYRLNRAILLFSIAGSWILPLAVPYLVIQGQQSVGLAVDFPVVVGVVETIPHEHTLVINWIAMIGWLYLSGCLVSLVVGIIGAVKMARIIKCGNREQLNGRMVVVSPIAPGPFSWGNYIIMRPEDCDRDVKMVLEHEEEHLSRFHWVDLALAQLTAIMQWFNPAAWLMIRELKNLHEYEVDENLDSRYGKGYQIMLIRKTVGPSFPTFADSLNHSQIKNRLTMMMKNHSKPMRRLAVLAMPAMAAFALVALSQPAVANVINSLAPTENEEQTVEIGIKGNDNSNRMQLAVEEEPIRVVGIATYAKADAQPNPVIFVDGKRFDGDINSINPADIKSMQVKQNNPEYPEGQILIFTKQEGQQTDTVSTDEVFHECEQVPEYEGGIGALMQYVAENLRFPEGVTLAKPERAVVQFVIGKNGTVTDARVVKSAGVDALDQEAIRVVQATSGKWSPGKNNGVPVAVSFTLPVVFAPKAE